MPLSTSTTLLPLLLSLCTTISSTILPIVQPTTYPISITSFALTDPTRQDPFAPSPRPRSLMASAYTPVPFCAHKTNASYMPPATAAYQDTRFSVYGLPNGTFEALELQVCGKPAARSRSCGTPSFPLVVFSGALGTSRLLYSSMLQSVAAAGYVVVSLDHPYDTDIVEFPDGSTVEAIDISSDTDLEKALTTRVQDIGFLYSQLANTSFTAQILPGSSARFSVSNTAVFGHSFGGAAAAAALLEVPSLKGALDIDGTLFGPILTTGTAKPFMLLGHENKTQATDPSWQAVWGNLAGWKKEYEVKGSAHYSFSDLPLIASSLGFQELLPAEVGEVLGVVEGKRMMEITVAYVTGFLDYVLKSGSEKKLEQASKEFPEVVQAA